MLDNYAGLLDDPVFWQALRNNVWYAVATIPASIVLALLMALAVNEALPGRALLRMAYFLPTMLPMIAVANIWMFFYTPDYGLFDRIIALFGGGRHNWLGDASTALPAMIAVAVWKEAGFFMIFYLAALQTMPTDLREAAALEGSSRWNYLRRVILPLLMPTTLFVLVNAVINAFRVIDHIIVMTRGGPDNATTLLLYLCLRSRLSLLGHRSRGIGDGGSAVHHGARRCIPVRRPGPTRALPMMVADHSPIGRNLETLGAWTLGVLWMLPLLYAVWTAFHPAIYATHFDPLAPLTLANLKAAWQAAPFTRYLINTVALVTLILAAQFVLCTLAAFAFARLTFPGRDLLFAVVLLQLMVMPDILLVENYRTLVKLHLADTILAIALPYLGSAFGIFLLRQTFLTIPQPLDDAARLEGCGLLARLWRVYVPLARPTYIAYGLVSVSYHWNNFLWPLIITNSVTTRPLTVGLAVFATTDQGIDWSIVTAATLMTSAPLLVAFLLFQRQFVQSFMRAGIR